MTTIKIKKQQSGFIMILLVVILVVGATTYFVGVTNNLSWQFKNDSKLRELDELNHIKKQLLLYASNFSELYANASTSPHDNLTSNLRPAPGYLPCPFDRVANSISSDCVSYTVDPSGVGEPGYIAGFLPPGITTRLFHFAGDYFPEANHYKNYILIIDERFAYKNSHYHSGVIDRFSPLNDNLPVDPVLRLNDNPTKKYVALVVSAGLANKYTGQDQNNASLRPAPTGFPLNLNGYLDKRFSDEAMSIAVNNNQDGDFQFYSAGQGNFGVNDVIVGITYEEWQDAVRDSVCSRKVRLVSATATNFWFETYHSATNPSGAGWRGRLGAFCP